MADNRQHADAVVAEKANLSENDMSNDGGQVTMASFAHLDEKKILRKVIRLNLTHRQSPMY